MTGGVCPTCGRRCWAFTHSLKCEPKIRRRQKPKPLTGLLLKEIGERINAHLQRFEKDPKINIDRSPHKTGLHDYFHAWANASGRYCYVKYISYQGTSHLTKTEALAYLAWLDAGNHGTHYTQQHGSAR